MVLFQDIISYYPCKSIPQSVYFHHVAMKNLRETFCDMTSDEMREASREAEIAEWREGNRFCEGYERPSPIGIFAPSAPILTNVMSVVKTPVSSLDSMWRRNTSTWYVTDVRPTRAFAVSKRRTDCGRTLLWNVTSLIPTVTKWQPG